ncbi:hypothetical protein [Aquiflexum sp.]|uniref:hypothetical protein n=1 Tax=Aquiflexum sp. TaxID=1872584 RepID=UPI003593C52F
MIGDLSNDQIGYSIHIVETSKNLIKEIMVKYTKDGESYQELVRTRGSPNPSAGIELTKIFTGPFDPPKHATENGGFGIVRQ